MNFSNVKRYFYDTFNKRSSIAALFALVLAWIFILWRVVPLESDIVLHYTVHLGTDWIGPSWYALYVPLVGVALFVVNTFLAMYVARNDPMFARLITGFNIFIQVLVLFASIILVLANV